jgi:hypothetical protein
MSDIEKEFFEAFGIEPNIQNDYCYWECKDPKKQFKPCKKKSCEHFKSGYKTYPLITSDIVLGLEEIAMQAIWLYGGDRLIYTNENGLHKYFAENYSDKVLLKGDNKKEALLKFFLHGYAIRKEDVQNKVKALFKC